MEDSPVRFGVVGLGYISQVAFLPALKSSKKGELAALFSSDSVKLKKLGRKYRCKAQFSYADFAHGLQESGTEAVYIATPNTEHSEFAVRAAEQGVHVLCEKPLAATTADALRIVDACSSNGVKLMVAYRLHFEPATLQALEMIRKGKIGDPRTYFSSFSMQLSRGNYRGEADLGGGPLLDLGIYCINGVRNLFFENPSEVCAFDTRFEGSDRFKDVETNVVACLKFPSGRLATLCCSFETAGSSHLHIVGTRGVIWLAPAFDFSEALALFHRKGMRTKRSVFKKRDQFIPLLEYFGECVRTGADPEPSGTEGVIDVRIIEAIRLSASTGEPVELNLASELWPTPEQKGAFHPPKPRVKLVHARAPSIQ